MSEPIDLEVANVAALPDDTLLRIWNFLDDTCLIRIHQVSRHWRTCTPPSFWKNRCQQIGGAGAARPAGWSQSGCGRIGTAPSGPPALPPRRALTAPLARWMRAANKIDRDGWRHVHRELAFRPHAPVRVALEAVSSTSQDFEQSANCALDPDVTRFWSSTGSSAGGPCPRSCPDQLLVYRCPGGLCALDTVSLVPFRCGYQPSHPCYAPRKFRVVVSLDMQALHVTWTSPDLDVLNVNDVFCYQLAPLIVVGKYVHVHLVGRQQTQESDNLYYVCMQSVAVTGIKVEPTLAEYLRHASDWARATHGDPSDPRDDALARCLAACADRPRDWDAVAARVGSAVLGEDRRWSLVLQAGDDAPAYLRALLGREVRLTAEETLRWWQHMHGDGGTETAGDSEWMGSLFTTSEALADTFFERGQYRLAGAIYNSLGLYAKYINTMVEIIPEILTAHKHYMLNHIIRICEDHGLIIHIGDIYRPLCARGLSRSFQMYFLIKAYDRGLIEAEDACRVAYVECSVPDNDRTAYRALLAEMTKYSP